MMFPQLRVPELFEDCTGSYHEKYAKISERLCELAEAGTLCVTQLLNQPESVYDTIGEVILGRAWDVDGSIYGLKGYNVNVPTQSALDDLMVTVESVNGEKISFDDGVRRKDMRQAGAASRRKIKQPQFEENTKVLGLSASVSLRDAYLILRQRGVYCVPEETPESQKRKWKVIEINDEVPWREILNRPKEAPAQTMGKKGR